ncbi:hypothetical protein AX16_009290 [Volvariella volvacea WC 439]|nr:hypothetical protein AX16_009290 [Volvariella volvacea WC 439]
MQIGYHHETIDLVVVNLGSTNVFIGFKWLIKHNPLIDWQTSDIILERCPESCKQEQQELWFLDSCEETLPQPYSDIHYINDDKPLPYLSYMYLRENNIKTINPSLEIPKYVHPYADVFSEQDFETLPERRPWDHAIDLIPGSKPKDCGIYSLNPKEQKALDEFIDTNLKSGRIRLSKSLMASPFFFIKKKDGGLRPVQDYQKLNEMTIKNKYPLPLIQELIDKVKHSKVFTKFDVHWGYNNIRIKKEDEWKAAFKTNRGLFKLTVMFFGLTNSPATFQTFMNHIFRDLVNEGHVIVYIDNILIFTEDVETHQQVVEHVLEVLRENKLYLKLSKCFFEVPKVEYLRCVSWAKEWFGWTQRRSKQSKAGQYPKQRNNFNRS